MRRLILALALTLAACAEKEPAPSGLMAGTYQGGNRDALCIAGLAGAQRGGFIVYGVGNANCSVSGKIAQGKTGWDLVAEGDAGCRIPLNANADRISLGPATTNCAYYCGPRAAYSGKSFKRSPSAGSVADLAGDPLC